MVKIKYYNWYYSEWKMNNGLRGENDFLKNFNIFCQNNCVVYSNLRLGKPKPIQKNHSLTIIGSSRRKESLAENLYRHNQKKKFRLSQRHRLRQRKKKQLQIFSDMISDGSFKKIQKNKASEVKKNYQRMIYLR